MPKDDTKSEVFWGSDRIERLHPRVAADLMIDAQFQAGEAKVLLDYLKAQGFAPDLLRAKGYLNKPFVVGVLPLYTADLGKVASVSVRKNVVDGTDTSAPASATTVRMSGATNPIEFTILRVEGDNVVPHGPTSFNELVHSGSAAIFQKLAAHHAHSVATIQFTRGRALSPLVLEDLATDEVRLGFIGTGEFYQIMAQSDMYAEVARLHSYLALVGVAREEENGGCSYCTSSSCYACTSCSCHIL
jgi:hypothetical protein